ncbi:hypothetical protein Ahy_A04g017077 isoform A [Arachis hypogaea]|uniref:peptidylprolyl isomerase n=1 Tax=Arachis hypogaea TaxID=3818 RepID=A0A445D9W7_ARAHY|nr:hypothetical protein Ahy_A04g017077 isoform A [Arachis hypogaea]
MVMASILSISSSVCLSLSAAKKSEVQEPSSCSIDVERRKMLVSSVAIIAGSCFSLCKNSIAVAAEYADMPALRGKDYGKTKMRYPDYTETESGLQFKDLRPGYGPKPNKGDTVVVIDTPIFSIIPHFSSLLLLIQFNSIQVDWDGYTIGYYGRIFEARNKTKGGSFEGDEKDFFKFRIGYQEVIPAFEEAVSGMALGGIRRCLLFS